MNLRIIKTAIRIIEGEATEIPVEIGTSELMHIKQIQIIQITECS